MSVELEAIRAARERIAPLAVRTPCLRAARLSEVSGVEVFLKCENLQRTGSFKVRGAANRMHELSEEERESGVICASAGNHAQGVAFAAAGVGAPALIVMPELTPQVKIAQTERWGAEVLLHGATFDEAYARAREVEKERGLCFVHPFDDDTIIAGQGTVGLEILDAIEDLDAVVVPIGGGGLIAGIASAVKSMRPEVAVYGVQSEASPAMLRSLEAGELVAVDTSRSIAEGIAVKSPGERTFRIVEALVDDIVLVSETELESAVFRMLEAEKLVAEGAGAATYAALLEPRIPGLAGHDGARVVAVVSGGNIDLTMLGRLIERSLVRQHRLTRLRVYLQDRPGALAALLAIVGERGANVMRIHHNRFFTDSSFWETEVELTLETRDEDQVETLRRALAEAGYDRIEEPDLNLVAAPILGR